MAGPGLPTRVANDAWQTWLRDYPVVPAQTLGAAMQYNRSLGDHLDGMPDAGLLNPRKRRLVADDLAHYCRVLQQAQETSLREAWISLLGSGAAVIAKIYFPGAEIFLLLVAAGAGVLALARAYDIKRRERVINALVRRVDDLSWDLKR